MAKWKRDWLWMGALYLALAAIALGALLYFDAKAKAQAQTCTPVLFQGWPSSCSAINLRWLNRDPASSIDHYEIYIGSQLRGTAPGSALSYSDLVGCGFGANYIIKQVMKSGTSCQTVTTGGPHTGPCSTCGVGASAGVSIVSSANFRGQVTRDSLVSLFPDPGVSFTDRAELAPGSPLPTTLAGVTVEADGQLCRLIAVSPGQINLLLPETLPVGPTEVLIVVSSTRGSVARFSGRAQVNPLAPGIFTADATGTGTAAAVWLVVDAKGKQAYYAAGRLPNLLASDRVFLLLYGTGIHATEAELRLGNGRTFGALYVGPAPGFSGLVQLTFQIPIADVWRNELGASVRVFVSGGHFETQGFSVK